MEGQYIKQAPNLACSSQTFSF